MDRQISSPRGSKGRGSGGRSRHGTPPSPGSLLNTEKRSQRNSPRAEYRQYLESTHVLGPEPGDSSLHQQNDHRRHESGNGHFRRQPEYNPANDYTLLGMHRVCSDFATTNHIYKLQDQARERKLQTLRTSSFKDLKNDNDSHEGSEGSSCDAYYSGTRRSYFGRTREPRLILDKAESEKERQRSIVKGRSTLNQISRSIESAIDSGNAEFVRGPYHPLQANLSPMNSVQASQAQAKQVPMPIRRLAPTGIVYRDPFMPHQTRLTDEFEDYD